MLIDWNEYGSIRQNSIVWIVPNVKFCSLLKNFRSQAWPTTGSCKSSVSHSNSQLYAYSCLFYKPDSWWYGVLVQEWTLIKSGWWPSYNGARGLKFLFTIIDDFIDFSYNQKSRKLWFIRDPKKSKNTGDPKNTRPYFFSLSSLLISSLLAPVLQPGINSIIANASCGKKNANEKI